MRELMMLRKLRGDVFGREGCFRRPGYSGCVRFCFFLFKKKDRNNLVGGKLFFEIYL